MTVAIGIAPDFLLPTDGETTFTLRGAIRQAGAPGIPFDTPGVLIGELADLQVDLFVDKLHAFPGETISYTALVTNFGPSSSRNVVVKDTAIATALTQGRVRANACSLSLRTEGGTISTFSCNFAASSGVFDLFDMAGTHLNPFGSDPDNDGTVDQGRMLITLSLTANQELTLNNLVVVNSATADPDLTNNSDETSLVEVAPLAEIAVSKTAVGEVTLPGTTAEPFVPGVSPAPFPAPGYGPSTTAVSQGRRIRYSTVVTNNGPSAAVAPIVADALPGWVSPIPHTLAVSGTASSGNCLFVAGPTLQCALETLPAGEEVSIQFDVVVGANAPAGSFLTSSLTADSAHVDPDYSNNSAASNLQVSALAARGLSGQLSFTEGEVIAGEAIQLELSVEKLFSLAGDSTSASAAVLLPPEFRYVSDTGGCDPSGLPLLVCPLGDLTVGDTASILVSLQAVPEALVGSGGPKAVQLESSLIQDGEAPHDLSPTPIYISEMANLGVQAFASHEYVYPGELFGFSAVVTNYGPSAAREVALLNAASAGTISSAPVQLVSCALEAASFGITLDSADCDFALQQGTFNFAEFGLSHLNPLRIVGTDIEAGRATVQFQFVALDELSVNGLFSVNSDTPDWDDTNNSSTASLKVKGAADLTAELDLTGELLKAGEQGVPFSGDGAVVFPEGSSFEGSSVSVTSGRRISVSARVRNLGPSDAQDVVASLVLPPRTSLVPDSLVTTGGSSSGCALGPIAGVQQLLCGVGVLPAGPGNSATVSFQLVADFPLPVGTRLTASIAVTSATTDRDTGDNYDLNSLSVTPLVGFGECTVGGSYQQVQCGTGSASVDLIGFGFTTPSGGPLTYSWSTTCPGGVFSDATAAEPTLNFTTVVGENVPVSCQVELEIDDGFSTATCTGPVTVVDCTFDCRGNPGGSAELDRCGVCEGNGASCLGCQPFNVSQSVADLDRANLALRRLARRVARRLKRIAPEKNRGIGRLLRIANKIVVEATTSNGQLPVVGQTCSNVEFCTSAAVAPALEQGGTSAERLQQVVRKLVRRFRRASGKRRAMRRTLARASELTQQSLASLFKLPAITSSCS